MRTRRSPHNQDRLFRSLFPPTPAPAPLDRSPVDRARAVLADPFSPKRDKRAAQRTLDREALRESVRARLGGEA